MIRDLERITHMQEVGKGQLISGPQINCDKVYLLKKGSINIYYVLNGKKIIIDTLTAGDIFGDIRGVGSDRNYCEDNPFAEAREESIISLALGRDLVRLLQRYPELGIQVLQKVGNRLNRAEKKIQDLALRTVSERIVRELSRLAEISGEDSPTRYVVNAVITHEQLAMMVGATRETVTKALTSLRERGIVVIEKNHYVINKQITQPSFKERQKV